MKCPSCGIWNRAHFTKCFRCGADLPDAAAPQETPAEPQQRPLARAEFASESSPDLPREPVAPAAPIKEAPDAKTGAQEDSLGEIFSLYDEGNWDDDAEEDTETVYGAPAAPVIRPVPALEEEAESAPKARRLPLPVDTEEDDDEPLTAYIAPHLPEDGADEPSPNAEEAAVQETRRFNPVPASAVDGGTRRFSLKADKPETRQPIPDVHEPEVAPVDPGISHEIIHAIFTNPPTTVNPEHVSGTVEEPRPRKLMSRKRLPPRAEPEEEPATVYKPAKAEPRVDNVEAFKPTARMAAQKADEQGDEFKAFATAKRSLVAEVEPTDPFDEAIALPKQEPREAAPDAEAQTPPPPAAGEPEAEAPSAPAAEKPLKKAPPAPAAEKPAEPAPPSPAAEPPAWVKEALFNLRHGDDFDNQRRPAPPKNHQPARKAPSARQAAREEEPPMRYERPARRPQAPSPAAPTHHAPPRERVPQDRATAPARSGLDAIARHDAGRSSSILQRRAEANEQEEIPQGSDRPAARQEVPGRGRTFRATQAPETPVTERPRRAPRQPLPPPERPDRQTSLSEEAPMRLHSSRSAGESAPKAMAGLKVQNLNRLIAVGAAALVLLGLLIWGVTAGVKALMNREKTPPEGDPTLSTSPAPQTDPNAPAITTGEINGRPAHIITFKGNDGDIIYVSDANKENVYNIDIVDGQGELKIEDSALIGDRYVTEDVEVTLNPTLHEAGSGKETKLNPVTFTVTPPEAYLEIVSPAGGADETTLGTYQVKIRVQMGSSVTIDEKDVSDLIAPEDNGVGSIVFNVDVEAKGENSIPITVMQKGCKSVTKNISLTRPSMAVPIELDAATPTSVQSDSVQISGSVEAGVKVSVTSPISGDVTVNADGTFSFVAKFASFGDNEVVIVATKGEESSTLTHVITYMPTYNDFVQKAYAMDYNTLTNFAGKFQPFLCSGQVVEILGTEPFTCTYNVGTQQDPKYIYLQMVEGKSLEMGKRYKVYADVHADGVKDGYPYMIGRYFDLVGDAT